MYLVNNKETATKLVSFTSQTLDAFDVNHKHNMLQKCVAQALGFNKYASLLASTPFEIDLHKYSNDLIDQANAIFADKILDGRRKFYATLTSKISPLDQTKLKRWAEWATDSIDMDVKKHPLLNVEKHIDSLTYILCDKQFPDDTQSIEDYAKEIFKTAMADNATFIKKLNSIEKITNELINIYKDEIDNDCEVPPHVFEEITQTGTHGENWPAGSVITMFDDEDKLRIVTNFGTRGEVEYLDGQFVSNRFYWVYGEYKAKLVKLP
jgi:hypothetical protein